MPDDYYVSRYSGEEIDDLLGKANAAVRYDAAQSLTPTQQHTAQKNIGTTWPCNPNLLDNWYFGNPVNQRGATSYTARGYTIDRWFAEDDTAVSISADGLTAVGEQTIIQKIEEKGYEQIKGQVVTASVLLSDGTFSSGSGQWNDDNNVIANFPGGSFRCAAFRSANSFQAGRMVIENGQEKTILAAKLELGDTQTLAHKEGDTWVLNEIPDYGEQLRRCQRYFVRFNNAYASGHTATTQITFADLITPVPMRANPVVTVNNYGAVSTNGSAQAPSQITLALLIQNHVYLNCALPNAVNEGHVACLHDAAIDLSADL